MSSGSKAIMEQKQEKDAHTHMMKEELFKKYGNNKELSVIDLYIQS